jgi:hypothetical protein
MDPLNTHTYDYKLDPSMITIPQIPLHIKIDRGQELYTIMINKNYPTSCLTMFHTLIQRMGTSLNYEPTTKIVIDDLIACLWEYRNNESFLEVLESQLTDMIQGSCVQGCCHRLFQLIMAFQPNPIQSIDQSSDPLIVVDEFSDPLISTDQSSDPLVATDESSDPLIVADESSDPLIATDQSSDPLVAVDSASDQLLSVDSSMD